MVNEIAIEEKKNNMNLPNLGYSFYEKISLHH